MLERLPPPASPRGSGSAPSREASRPAATPGWRGWQPIQSAPQRTPVLVFNGDGRRGIRVAELVPGAHHGDGWAFLDGFGWMQPRPTHWMPLPPLPAPAGRSPEDGDPGAAREDAVTDDVRQAPDLIP